MCINIVKLSFIVFKIFTLHELVIHQKHQLKSVLCSRIYAKSIIINIDTAF